MFLVYGDESLDEKKERVCAVAGLVGPEHCWADLESKWKALHGEIPYHAKDCESDHGDFEPRPGDDVDANHRRNQELHKQSAILLAESGVGGYAAAYDLAAQREAFPPPYVPPVYYQPFLDVMEKMKNLADNQEETAEFIFDSRVESEANAALIYAHIRESHPEWQERIAEKISFVSSRKNVRIQIADLFAREVMKILDNQIGPKVRAPRKSWLALEATGKFRVDIRGRKHFEDAKEQIRSIDSIAGMSNEGFAIWLQEKGRPWNVTNYLQYVMHHLKGLSEEQRTALAEKLKDL